MLSTAIPVKSLKLKFAVFPASATWYFSFIVFSPAGKWVENISWVNHSVIYSMNTIFAAIERYIREL